MPDALTIISKLIQSPPGQLVAGAALAGIVWKFFERVENVLNEDTKLEIAVWLLGRKKFSPEVEQWPETFSKVFDRVFAAKHLSWKCFGRSSLASFVLASALFLVFAPFSDRWEYYLWPTTWAIVIANVLPDYSALWVTRIVLRAMKRSTSPFLLGSLLLCDFVGTLYISVAGASAALLSVLIFTDAEANKTFVSDMLLRRLTFQDGGPLHFIKANLQFGCRFPFYVLPAFVTSVWLWLYAGSGFLLKAARRFDIGFEWFNRKFDIEKKPLQSIGLVAGALVAVVYWTAVIVSRVVG